MDRAIGRLLAEPDRLGLADNTPVVFTNDLARVMPGKAATLREALQQSLAAMDARLPTRLADDQARDDQ